MEQGKKIINTNEIVKEDETICCDEEDELFLFQMKKSILNIERLSVLEQKEVLKIIMEK